MALCCAANRPLIITSSARPSSFRLNRWRKRRFVNWSANGPDRFNPKKGGTGSAPQSPFLSHLRFAQFVAALDDVFATPPPAG